MPLLPRNLAAALPWILRVLYLLWAGFWCWFVLAVSAWESPPPPWWIPTLWIGTLAFLAFATWRWPLPGGLLLIVLSLLAFVYFPTSGARALLSAPGLALGLAFSGLAFSRPR